MPICRCFESPVVFDSPIACNIRPINKVAPRRCNAIGFAPLISYIPNINNAKGINSAKLPCTRIAFANA